MEEGHNKIDELFNLFKENDEYAFSYFYKLYFNDLYSYGISFGINHETVQDIIQDIFYKIYNDKHKFKSSSHLKFYLLKSLRNSLYDLNRKKTKNKFLKEEDILSFSLNITVLDNIIEKEDRAIIQQKVNSLLALLTARQQEIIVLRYMKGLDYDEIAEILNMSIHGVRKLTSRAISRLKRTNTLNILLTLIMLAS